MVFDACLSSFCLVCVLFAWCPCDAWFVTTVLHAACRSRFHHRNYNGHVESCVAGVFVDRIVSFPLLVAACAPYVLSVSFRPQTGPASPWRRVFMLILVKGKCCRLDVCFCAHPHVTFDLCVFPGCERPSACLPSSYQVPRLLTPLLPTRNLLMKLDYILRKSGKKLALFVSCVCEHNGR